MPSLEVRALWELIEQRIAGGDHATIDEEIWRRFGGEWAVMLTDLAGFSRQVARFGIVHFLQTIHQQTRALVPIVQQHGGALVKTEADSMLILFPTATAAVESGIAMQRACHALGTTSRPEDKVMLCLGIGFGRLLKIGDDEVFGHEVNLASKLGEDIAVADEILVTPSARAACARIEGLEWEQQQTTYAGETICWRVRYR